MNSNDILHCENPGSILNGRVRHIPPGARFGNGRPSVIDDDLNEYPEGTRLDYTCDEGFDLQGAETLTCQPTGFWSSEAPVCVGGMISKIFDFSTHLYTYRVNVV